MDRDEGGDKESSRQSIETAFPIIAPKVIGDYNGSMDNTEHWPS